MDDRLQNSVNGYAAHVGRVIHQHEVLKYQKENLQFNETVIHLDFSENYNFVADAAGTTVLHMRELSCLAPLENAPFYGCGQYPGQLKNKLNVDEVYGTNSDDGDDLNVTIKARNTNIDLNSIDIAREEDVRVEYLVRCSKEHDLFKGNPNSVDHECSVSDIIDVVLNPTITKKGKRQVYRLGRNVEDSSDGMDDIDDNDAECIFCADLWSEGKSGEE
ncbi:hypothetical protein PR048_000736 [Dryococelus australis]|uniref:Uncharacterized protein n=1 Tax=Dryococelus australis TaxID=614101 RepID=A0ABQ9IGP5_9NEOP|nr:hypothetical protein PR048_000736 [Dryococelus australis]